VATSNPKARVGSLGRVGRASSNGILYPLDLAYSHAGVPLPKVRRIAATEIPSPYHSLLVHENDMTFTLERHFGGPVVLRPLSTMLTRGWYLRRVLLVQAYSGRPVEMGAIRLKLRAFDPHLQSLILRNEIPFGRLLREAHIDFKSRPRVFIELEPNPEMMGVFWMREPRTLYGRQTEAFHGGVKIGDIVEILPLV
jgi:hypothetical protein